MTQKLEDIEHSLVYASSNNTSEVEIINLILFEQYPACMHCIYEKLMLIKHEWGILSLV